MPWIHEKELHTAFTRLTDAGLTHHEWKAFVASEWPLAAKSRKAVPDGYTEFFLTEKGYGRVNALLGPYYHAMLKIYQIQKEPDMRNTLEHPITKDEIVAYLNYLKDNLSYQQTGRIGDMGPVLLAKAIEIIETGKFDPT